VAASRESAQNQKRLKKLLDKPLCAPEEWRHEMNGSKRGALLRVSKLKQHFRISKNFTVKAVDEVSFEIARGEIYGLCGESGSGKSTLGRSLIRLYDLTAGEIFFNGCLISGKFDGLDKTTKKMLRTKMQMIFQDSSASLNPRRKVIDLVAEGLDIHRFYTDASERAARVYDVLERVGLARELAGRYPHQISGGQRQRVGIARALVMNPDLIIADEPLSALDVSVQAQIVNLIKDIQQKSGIAFLFISHDLSMLKYISDRIGVLHFGRLVETGPTREIFKSPVHPYTRSLLSAIPRPDPREERNRDVFRRDVSETETELSSAFYRMMSPGHFVRMDFARDDAKSYHDQNRRNIN
jgi:oligopeptide transport system ATP-binding protein